MVRSLIRDDQGPSGASISNHGDGAGPANYGRVVADDERIAKDSQYAFNIARSYADQMPEGRRSLADQTIVEFGPGINFGTALVLACWGARQVTVCDRFLASYQLDYHGPVYQAVMDLVLKDNPTTDVSPLRDCIERRGHLTPRLRGESCALEELAKKYPDTFDIALSNAVFEHLYHPLQAFKSLHICMKSNGVGYHQVDFRDHRDFSKPLEYLLLDEFSFHAMMTERHCECGNRVRPHEMRAMFACAGFRRIEFFENMWSEAAYLQDFVPRLRKSEMSSYSDLDADLLKVISGRYVITK